MTGTGTGGNLSGWTCEPRKTCRRALALLELVEDGSKRADAFGRDRVDHELDVGDAFTGEGTKGVRDLGRRASDGFDCPLSRFALNAAGTAGDLDLDRDRALDLGGVAADVMARVIDGRPESRDARRAVVGIGEPDVPRNPRAAS